MIFYCTKMNLMIGSFITNHRREIFDPAAQIFLNSIVSLSRRIEFVQHIKHSCLHGLHHLASN